MSYRGLRVINDDVIGPGGGFPMHGHRDMEIVTWVLRGALRHRDSLGSEGVITPGEVQAMSAGRGIRHSEFNDSDREDVRLLQVWIVPRQQGLAPGYRQASFEPAGRANRWQLLASGWGPAPAPALALHADAALRVADLSPGATLQLEVPSGRHAYLHVSRGSLRAGEHELVDGDALTLTGPATLGLEAHEEAQALAFELG
jgi:redox-sensitive bicupin YhaK (pirin superfamily)